MIGFIYLQLSHHQILHDWYCQQQLSTERYHQYVLHQKSWLIEVARRGENNKRFFFHLPVHLTVYCQSAQRFFTIDLSKISIVFYWQGDYLVQINLCAFQKVRTKSFYNYHKMKMAGFKLMSFLQNYRLGAQLQQLKINLVQKTIDSFALL